MLLAFLLCVGTISVFLLGSPRDMATCLFGLASCLGAYAYTSHARHSLRLNTSLRVDLLADTLVIVPFDRWSSVTKKGIDLALQLKGQVRILHVECDGRREELEALWQRNVVSPLASAGKRIPELVILEESHGYVVNPMAKYILSVERECPNRLIVVIVPQLAARHWWHRPLHNYRNRFLKLILSARGSQRIMIIDLPWYL